MNTQLGWTTLEQSKKLVSAGLEPNTADMNYRYCICKCIDGEPKEDWLLETGGVFEECPDKQIPCWSLGRLIELMPFNPTINGIKAFFQLNQIGCRYTYRDDDLSIKEVVVFANSNLINNVISMVCWLLENNYIKKRETK